MFGLFLHFGEVWLISLKNFVLHKSSIDSISVRTQVCPSHRKPRSRNLGVSCRCIRNHVVQSLWWHFHFHFHFHFLGPCIRWTSFIAGPALVKALPHLLIAFPCLLPAHQPFFLRSKKVPWNVGTIWHLC